LENRDQFMEQSEKGLVETLVVAACLAGNRGMVDELAAKLPAGSPMTAFIEALRVGEVQQAIDALESWNDRESPEQLLSMNASAYALGQAGARNTAVQILSDCSRRYPEHGVSLLNLAYVFRGAEMPDFAAQALRRLTASHSDNLEAHLILFQVLREADNKEEARQVAEVMYALFPDSRKVILATIGIYVDVKHLDLARVVAGNYLQAHPGDAEIQLAQATVMFREGLPDEALAVLGGIAASGKLASGTTTLSALSYLLLERWQDVIDTVGSGDSNTLTPATRLALAAAHAKLGQKEQAVAALQPLVDSSTAGGLDSAVVQRILGSDSLNLDEKHVAFADAVASDDATTADFIAALAFQSAKLYDAAYLALKRVDAAVPYESEYLIDLLYNNLRGAARIENPVAEAALLAEQHKSQSRAWLGYASVQRQEGDPEGQLAALDQALEAGPDSPLVFLRRGDYFASRGQEEEAVREYRKAVELRPNDPIGNNNLAYNLLLSGGSSDEALAAAERAAQKLPRHPKVLHTLGAVQLQRGDLEGSKKNLSLALQQMPGEPSLMLDYGNLLIATGDLENGVRHVRNALDTARVLGIEFDRKDQAEAVLLNHAAS
jgi:Tfp pilus assembly protein PilF